MSLVRDLAHLLFRAACSLLCGKTPKCTVLGLYTKQAFWKGRERLLLVVCIETRKEKVYGS